MSDEAETAQRDEPAEVEYPVILMPQLPTGAQGPACIWCNAPTKRTGACFTCIACGSTTSC